MKNMAILGSTGSIGKSCLEIIRRNPEKYAALGLACGSNVQEFLKQVEEFKPSYVYIKSAVNVELPNGVTRLDSLSDFANIGEIDSILFATVGFTSALAVIAAIENHKQILLANKETLVCAGSVITALAKKHGVPIIPVDSEHSAIWQCLMGQSGKHVRRLILTASGGAFRDFSYEMLKNVTAKDALKHPNWNMGNKITIDSSTLMNKGLEIIEAKWLFDVDISNIDYIMHRESIIHSMVEFEDSSVLAQMSYPTMEIPITLAMSYPQRIPTSVPPLDFSAIKTLNFEPIDTVKFPCVKIAVECGKEGGIMPAVMNAANEVLVDAFLQGRVKYLEIAGTIEKVLGKFENISDSSIEDIFNADRLARNFTTNFIGQ